MIASLQPARLWRVSIAGIAAAGVGVALAGGAGLGFWAFVIAAAVSTVFVPFVVDLRPGRRAPAQPAPQAPAQPEPEQVRDMRQNLIATVEAMPQRERVVFMLHHTMRLSVSEIAGVLNTTPATVNSDLKRASDRLATAGWHGPERMALAERLLREIDWAEVGIYEIAAHRGLPRREP